MQSEFAASAVAWGFSTFSRQKCEARAVCSTPPPPAAASQPEAPPEQGLHHCSSSEELVISQGAPFEIGLEFRPLPSFTDTLEEFITSFEKHKQLLKFDLQMQQRGGGRAVLPRETADIQKCRVGDVQPLNSSLDKIIFRRRPGGFYIGTRTAIRLPQEYVNVPIQLLLTVCVVIPESSHPSNHRATMSQEELSLRALLEGGRYRVPRIDAMEVTQAAVVIDTLQVECWSKTLSPWTALLGVEMANVHPYKTVQVQNVEVNLPATLSIFEHQEPGGGARQFAPSHPPVHELLDVIPYPSCTLPASTASDVRVIQACSPVSIASGERQTVVFKVSKKDSCWKNMPTSRAKTNGGGREDNDGDGGVQWSCTMFAQALHGFVPPPSVSGDFVSPVDIRWFEHWPQPQLGAEAGADREVKLETETNEGRVYVDPESGAHFMQSTLPMYWHLDKRSGNDFVVDITGPAEGQLYQPVTLQVMITNHAAKRRDHLLVYLQDPLSISTSNLSADGGLCSFDDSFLNHDIALTVEGGGGSGGESSGKVVEGKWGTESVTLSAVVYPLQRGPLDFTAIYIVDAETGDIFTAASMFSMLIR